MILGYRIKSLRRDKCMSQNDLGKLLGVSKVSVSGYENGSRVPSMGVFMQILNVFNVSADYMLGRELNVVCESDESMKLLMAANDIDIIREIRAKPELYNQIAKDPKRFFASLNKNNI